MRQEVRVRGSCCFLFTGKRDCKVKKLCGTGEDAAMGSPPQAEYPAKLDTFYFIRKDHPVK